MKRWGLFLIAILILALLHEGLHALMALIFAEYEAFLVKLIGFEVVYKTPLAQRQGLHWALISGAGNLGTLISGYLLLLWAPALARSQSQALKAAAYYLTFLGLLVDPLNLSVGPLIYGGDANGIAHGLGVPVWAVQITALLVLAINRELIASRLLPVYAVRTDVFWLRPWLRFSVARERSIQ